MATIHDLVLVHIDHKPGFYARIEEITPDVKAGWWQVKLLVLSFPLQLFTWILDSSQIDGAPFTMAGTPIMLEQVSAPTPHVEEAAGALPGRKDLAGKNNKGAKVVSLAERKKER
jgi:hypothetical protein